MQIQKFLGKIENSYKDFLKSKIEKKDFNLVFLLPKIPIKGNEKTIDEGQVKLKNLSIKNEGIILNTIKTQKGTIIESIEFRDNKSYLDFIGKTKDFKIFCDNIDLFYSHSLSKLLFSQADFVEWLVKNIDIINIYTGKWGDILEVVTYFLKNKNSNLFLRELPIKVHTKFIENHKKIIENILDFLILKLELDYYGNNFEEKFFILSKPDFIRFRFLDPNLLKDFYGSKINDISLKIEDFSNLKLDEIEKVYIVENEINYLTFPFIKDSIIIWGAGFNIGKLKNIKNLENKNIYYWGDIDCHGYKILAMCRKYFPKTKSILMDRTTYDEFEQYKVDGKIFSNDERIKLKEFLTEDESDMMDFVYTNALRLEQENITQNYINIL